jgi:uncharacterized protein with PQ loop repeat
MGVINHHKHVNEKKKYPWEHRQTPGIDRLTVIVAIASPAMTLPQIYAIWFQDNTGVSIVSWVAYLIAAVVWLIYGIYHKEKMIIFSNAVWIFLDVAIITGILMAK